MATAAQAAFAGWWSGDGRIDGILTAWRWDVASIRYSDPDSRAAYGSSYVSDLDRDGVSAHLDGFGRLGASQLASVMRILDANAPGMAAARAGFAVEGFTSLGVGYAGAGSGAGDIRVANSRDAGTAYAWSPGAGVGGDVWLGTSGRAPAAGNYDHLTLLHEIGHALGLKHAHAVETSLGGRSAVPLAWDSLEFTVMTYRGWEGARTTGYAFETWGAPQSYMMLDIRALQQLYGADFTTNAGDTIYSWRPDKGVTFVDGSAGITPGANKIFATIWDGGGSDSYDLSAYRNGVAVDLRPGAASVFAAAQLADLGGGPNDGHARGNLFNALQYKGDARSLIETAIGGSGGDALTGNAAKNRLIGNDGDDRLCGDGGADTLFGGRGADRFIFDDGHSRPGACDRIMAKGASAFEGVGRSGGDLLDVRPIDADTTRSGDQAFVFGDSQGRGRLWAEDVGTVTYLRGNVDSDATPEFELAIHDATLRADDYAKVDFLL